MSEDKPILEVCGHNHLLPPLHSTEIGLRYVGFQPNIFDVSQGHNGCPWIDHLSDSPDPDQNDSGYGRIESGIT
jgi:hypothetical protein